MTSTDPGSTVLTVGAAARPRQRIGLATVSSPPHDHAGQPRYIPTFFTECSLFTGMALMTIYRSLHFVRCLKLPCTRPARLPCERIPLRGVQRPVAPSGRRPGWGR